MSHAPINWSRGAEVGSTVSGAIAPAGLLFTLAAVLAALFVHFHKKNAFWFYFYFLSCMLSCILGTALLIWTPYYMLYYMNYTSASTEQTVPTPPMPKPSSPPIVPQDKPPLSPVKSVPAPSLTPPETVSEPLSVVWAKRGFNILTKTELPIAVIAPNGNDPNRYLDNHAVRSVSSLLSPDLHLVLPGDAALLIKITGVRVDAGDTGQPCSNLYSRHAATAHVTVQIEWLDQKPLLFPREFSGSGDSCDNDNAASDNSIDSVAAKVADAILTIANKQVVSGTSQ